MKKEKRGKGGDWATTDIPHREQTTGQETKINRGGEECRKGEEGKRKSTYGINTKEKADHAGEMRWGGHSF